jgi:hypothetical protein
MQPVRYDKYTESFNIKIPEVLKISIEKMSPTETKTMNEEIRIVMARHVHNSANHFNPSLYLSSESAIETE